MSQLESTANKQRDLSATREYEFEESTARSVIWLSGQISKETVDKMDIDVVKELYYRGSWMADKLDQMIEGRCSNIGIPFADECEARFYQAQLRFGDLKYMRYSEATNPERTFELEFMIDRYIGRYMAEQADERAYKCLMEEFGVDIKSGRLSRRDVLKAADELSKGRLPDGSSSF